MASEIPCQSVSHKSLSLHLLLRNEILLRINSWSDLPNLIRLFPELLASLPFVDGETEAPEAKPPAKGDAMSGGSVGILLALTKGPVPISSAYTTHP